MKKEVESAVTAVENWVLNAVLTTMDNVVIRRVEMAVGSITGSYGGGPHSVVQNADHRDFCGNMENTPLMTASSRADLNIDRDGNDETRNVKNLRTALFRS